MLSQRLYVEQVRLPLRMISIAENFDFEQSRVWTSAYIFYEWFLGCLDLFRLLEFVSNRLRCGVVFKSHFPTGKKFTEKFKAVLTDAEKETLFILT